MKSRWVVALAAAAVVTPAMADWTGKAEAGLVVSTGNTETETGNVKLDFAHEGETWKNAIGASGLYASDDTGTTAQRWEAHAQSDYNFSPRTFWFGALRYDDDRFSGFEYQSSVSTGLGRKFIDTDRTKFVGTAGVGYKFYETEDVFDPDTGVLLQEGDRLDDIIFRGTLDFEHSFNESTKLIDKFIVEAGADNTFYQNDISLQVKMNAVLALAVGYSVRHNTDPPLGFEETDTLTTLNLVYELK